uniref:Cleavage stimulation factor 64 kDa subunit n=1 Tax=Lepeophtheirus salmonis TaxID=72036 RepID=C1BTS3_LEPSM|nr:Cleavage stimulation factor 64 kDa subunit [Lepeophtheirus salmonis]
MSSREFKGLPALADVNIKIKSDYFEENEPTPYRVIVKNFPPEATEAQLKELFSKVGSITMFKIQEPGMGLAYFRGPESTYEAVKELDEYGGTLSVELDLNPNLNETTNDGEISKAVASLPPEQMFELMKQMKHCIHNNPQEARAMLHQNPQLSYALLQAQVIMRIIDCESALDLLNQSQNKAGNSISPLRKKSPPPLSFSQTSLPPPVPPPIVPVPPVSYRDPRFNTSELHEGASSYENPYENRSRRDPRQSISSGSGSSSAMGVPRDPRNRDPRSHASNPQTSNVNHSLPPHLRDADPDKTALIMQVFQLTDDQIASLPFE